MSNPSGWAPAQRPMPDQPTGPHDPSRGYDTAPLAEKKRRNWPLWLAIIGAFILGVVVGSAVAAPDPAARPRAATASHATTATTEAPVATEAEPAYPTPKPSDFELSVKTLTKQCFGEAGCALTYRVVADWGPTYDPSIDYELTYRVTGPEDGAQIDTMTITGDEYNTTKEQEASTSSKYTPLKVSVVSVEEV